MRLTRTSLVVVVLSVAGVSALALMLARRAPGPTQTLAERASPPAQHSAAAYADAASCSTCHEDIARTYSLTGMGRAFSKVVSSEFPTPNRVYHKASDRYYTMVERDGRFYQRRHQIGFGGQETNAFELEAHFVVGSGNHARTFLHRTADGRLLQLPVSWYAERGGYWAMSPGYDKPAHLDFRRVIDAGCMSCHNGYPARRSQTTAPSDSPAFARRRCGGTGPASARRRSGTVGGASSVARGHRLPALSRAGAGTHRGGEDRRSRGESPCDCEPGDARPRTAARDVHAVPPRIDEQPAAVPGSPLRASAVFVPHPENPSATTSSISITRPEAVATTSSKLRAARTVCASRRVFSRAR